MSEILKNVMGGGKKVYFLVQRGKNTVDCIPIVWQSNNIKPLIIWSQIHLLLKVFMSNVINRMEGFVHVYRFFFSFCPT